MKPLSTLCTALAALSIPAQAQVLVANQQAYITVQPVFIRNDSGGASTEPASGVWDQFKAATQAIWDQAKISIVWNTPTYLDNSNLLNMTIGEADNLMAPHKSSSTIHLWVTDAFSVSGVNGYARESMNSSVNFMESGVVVANDIFSDNRYDVIAHEIGHNLGLKHDSLGAGSSAATQAIAMQNLMTDGGTRTSLGSIANVAPNGTGLAKLTGDLNVVNAAGTQIWQARSSVFVSAVPEPQTYCILFGGALVAFAGIRKVRARKSAQMA